MKGTVKYSGFDTLEKRFTRAAEVLSEPGVLNECLLEAVAPLPAMISANVERSGGPGPHTADDIAAKVWDNPPPGIARVDVGAHEGKNGRSYILRFLEYGTSKMSAKPAVRPAWDEFKPQLSGRIAAFLRKKLMPVLSGVRS